MPRRDVLNSPRLRELKRQRRASFLKKIFFFVLPFVLFLCALVYISRVDKLNISEINVTGNKVIETEQITKIVENNLSGHYLWVIPKSNFLLYPKDKIRRELEDKLPRLENLVLDLQKTKILNISLSEREGKYTWCGEELPGIGARMEEFPCYFMDKTGYIFDQAPYFSGDVYFRFFGQLDNSRFSPERFDKLVAFIDLLPYMKVKPASLYAEPDGDIEIYLSADTMPPNAPKIVLSRNFDLEKTSENLQAALGTEPLLSDMKTKYSSLLYIDLRFGNKVYFKFSTDTGE